MKHPDVALNYFEKNKELSLKRLIDLLKIPSISTKDENKKNCIHASDWLRKELAEIGFDVDVITTSGNPMVIAKFRGNGPHYLFYGHYDVQPIDPIELWKTDPFIPVIEDTHSGKVLRSRGSSDDKGQLMTFIEACRSFINTSGTLPCEITILLEGEEEIGSPSMQKFLEEHIDKFKVDYALVCDTNMWNENTPAIISMLRGLVGIELTIEASNRDLHSGFFGGSAQNPIHILSKTLSNLHDQNGKVTIDNFYDDVPEINKKLKDQWNELNFDEKKFLGNVGLSVPSGEKNFTALERLWSRPTCEVNGIWGGYIEPGVKTVLPSKASAKLTFRLVGNQKPNKILEGFKNHVKKYLPLDCKVKFIEKSGSQASQLDINTPVILAAEDALYSEWNVQPKLIGCGGSIPIGDHFKNILGIDSLMVGFALDNDNVHSPNEKYNLKSFFKGTRSWIRIIDNLSKIKY